MRRVVVVVPELLGEPSILRQRLPSLQRMAEMGRLFKLAATPVVETPEALYLGLRPDEGQLRQGPLTISALGADPPPRSTHFHLSLLSFTDDVAAEVAPRGKQAGPAVDPAELREILGLAKKLNSKNLTIVGGEDLDHGLVWENVGDLHTSTPTELVGNSVRRNLPEGDGEVLLRRFIDDSINLLSEIELNQRRIGEELPPLNLLWPWGEGVRLPVPNLALRRGEPAMVLSTSLRLQGLARLAGYRHAPIRDYGAGLNTRLSKIAEVCLGESVSIVVVEAIQDFRSREMMEEADWFVRELESKLLQPLFDEALLRQTHVSFLAPGVQGGLGASFATRDSNANSYPFDERALEEKSLGSSTLWEAVIQGLA